MVEQPNAAPLVAAGPPPNRRANTSMIAGIAGWALWLVLLCFNYTIGLILSLATFGIAGVCLGILGYLPVVPWIGAVVTGHMGLSQIAASGEGGRGRAIAGLIMGYLGVLLTVCTLALWGLALVGVSLGGLEGLLPTPPVP